MPRMRSASVRDLLDVHLDADPLLSALVDLGSDAIAGSSADDWEALAEALRSDDHYPAAMAWIPVGIPFFSAVARSASMTLPRLHSSMNAASVGLLRAANAARGCSAATAMNVTPMKTRSASRSRTHVEALFRKRANPSTIHNQPWPAGTDRDAVLISIYCTYITTALGDKPPDARYGIGVCARSERDPWRA